MNNLANLIKVVIDNYSYNNFASALTWMEYYKGKASFMYKSSPI